MEVGDGAAYWISGAPHSVVFKVGGEIEGEDLRLACNVLLWQHGDPVLRLEAQVPRDNAQRIARSMR